MFRSFLFFITTGQDIIKPEQIPDATVAHTNGPDFMFFDALRFIFKVRLARIAVMAINMLTALLSFLRLCPTDEVRSIL